MANTMTITPPPKIIWISRDGSLVQYHIPGAHIGHRFPVLLAKDKGPDDAIQTEA